MKVTCPPLLIYRDCTLYTRVLEYTNWFDRQPGAQSGLHTLTVLFSELVTLISRDTIFLFSTAREIVSQNTCKNCSNFLCRLRNISEEMTRKMNKWGKLARGTTRTYESCQLDSVARWPKFWPKSSKGAGEKIKLAGRICGRIFVEFYQMKQKRGWIIFSKEVPYLTAFLAR